MGNIYLASPNKSKNTNIDESRSLIYAASEMQGKNKIYHDTGWRNTMEDAHIHVCDL